MKFIFDFTDNKKLLTLYNKKYKDDIHPFHHLDDILRIATKKDDKELIIARELAFQKAKNHWFKMVDEAQKQGIIID